MNFNNGVVTCSIKSNNKVHCSAKTVQFITRPDLIINHKNQYNNKYKAGEDAKDKICMGAKMFKTKWRESALIIWMTSIQILGF